MKKLLFCLKRLQVYVCMYVCMYVSTVFMYVQYVFTVVLFDRILAY